MSQIIIIITSLVGIVAMSSIPKLTCDIIKEPHMLITNKTSGRTQFLRIYDDKEMEVDFHKDIEPLHWTYQIEKSIIFVANKKGESVRRSAYHNLTTGVTQDSYATYLVGPMESIFQPNQKQVIFLGFWATSSSTFESFNMEDNSHTRITNDQLGWQEYGRAYNRSAARIVHLLGEPCAIGGNPNNMRSTICYNKTSNTWAKKHKNLPMFKLGGYEGTVTGYNDKLYICMLKRWLNCTVYDMLRGGTLEKTYELSNEFNHTNCLPRPVKTESDVYLVCDQDNKVIKCKIKDCERSDEITQVCSNCTLSGIILPCPSDNERTTSTEQKTTTIISSKVASTTISRSSTQKSDSSKYTSNTATSDREVTESKTTKVRKQVSRKRMQDMITKYGSCSYQEDVFFKNIDDGIKSKKYKDFNDALQKLFPIEDMMVKPLITSKQAGFIVFTMFMMHVVTTIIEIIKYLYVGGVFGKIIGFIKRQP